MERILVKLRLLSGELPICAPAATILLRRYGCGVANRSGRSPPGESSISGSCRSACLDGSASEDPALLKARLAEIEVVHQNQDNREHDILDSDDYFQFQGGLHACIKQLRGSAPAVYHGDSSNPEQPRIRTLQEELVRVIRSRVLNPRWLEAMRRHGYKGAFEMAATVDYVFGYSATTGLIRDPHYEEIAQKLLLDVRQKNFFREHNPAALKEATQ